MNKQRILLIDNDPASISRLLDPLTAAGYEVEVASDGLAGLAAFGRVQPDLVLLEAMLPGKHGFEVCQEIKRSAAGRRVPVLMTMAVCRGPEYRTDAMRTSGCDEYLEKPIADQDLVGLCRRHLETRAAPPPPEPPRKTPGPAPESPRASASAVPALETLSEADIDARLDAMILDEDFATPIDAPPEPQHTLSAPPVAAARVTDIEAMSEAELMERLDAMVDSVAVPPPVPVGAAHPVVAERPVEAPPAPPLAPPARARSEPPAEPPPSSAAEIPTAPVSPAPPAALEPVVALPRDLPRDLPRGGSPGVLVGGLVLALLIVSAGGLAYRLGWVGPPGALSASRPADARTESQREAPAPVAEPEPPRFSSEKFRARLGAIQSVESPAPARPSAPAARPATASTGLERAATGGGGEQRPRSTAGTIATASADPAPHARDGVAGAVDEPRPRVFIDADTILSEMVRAEIVATPVAEPAAALPDLAGGLQAESLIGSPVRPTMPGDLVPLGSTDTPAVPLRQVTPGYDALAMRMRQEGTVVLNLLIDEHGDVIDAELLSGIPRSRLNDAAIRAARRWKYEPATKDGLPVKVWKTERLVFKL